MFYPIMTIEEIMPVLLIQESYNGLGTSNDLPRYNTKINSKLGGLVSNPSVTTIPNPLQRSQNQHVHDGTKGVLPKSVANHPEIEFCHKYGPVTLNGLDNEIKIPKTYNGSWRP